jgi:DNA polymerase III delta subunit
VANFTQWQAAFDRGDVRAVTWVCGPARPLVEQIVATLRVYVGDRFESVNHTYADTAAGEEYLWAVLRNVRPVGPRHLVIARHVESITTWRPLYEWMVGARSRVGQHLLLVAQDHDLAGADGVLAPHLAFLQAKPRFAMLVRCTDLSPAQATAWARRRGKLSEKVAAHLVARTGGDLKAMAAACDKLALFEGRPGIGVVDELTDRSPRAGFVDSLILLDKPGAVHLATQLDDDEVHDIIAALDQRLDLLGQLHAFAKTGRTIREMHGVPRHLAAAYLPVVKHYDAGRRSQIRQVLAIVDDAWRSGARDGVLEALVALW